MNTGFDNNCEKAVCILNIIFENCIINESSIKVVKMYAVIFDNELEK